MLSLLSICDDDGKWFLPELECVRLVVSARWDWLRTALDLVSARLLSGDVVPIRELYVRMQGFAFSNSRVENQLSDRDKARLDWLTVLVPDFTLNNPNAHVKF